MNSKIITTLVCVWLMILYGYRLSAQYCPPRENNLSDFDWTADSWLLYISPPESAAFERDVPSPYHPVNHAIQPNTSGIHEDSGMGDYRTEDGWVLVATRLSTSSNVAVRFPQFVLYNRFESKLRYFAYIADKKDADQIVVRVKFGRPSTHFTHVSAALEHINVPMGVVEGYTDSEIEINVPNEYREQSGVWVMADIPIAYDPCTCRFSSALQISTHSVNYNQLDFTLNGGGEIKQVVDGGKTVNQGNQFANVAGKIVNGVSKGVSSYKTAGELISVADKLLVESTNRRLTQDSRNIMATLGFLALGDDLTSSDIQSLYNIWTQGPANHPLRPLISELMPQKVTTVVPDWIKTAVPFANTAFALLDFIIGGGKTATPKPIHFNADFKFIGTGTMRDSAELDGLVFRVPGSNISTNLYAPRYDQVMGILNLVEQPVMHQAQQPEGEISPIPDAPEILFQSKSSLKLAAPLRYALNPASGLTLKDIRGALYFGCTTVSEQQIYEGLILESARFVENTLHAFVVSGKLFNLFYN